MWGFGWFVYDLPASFLIVPSALVIAVFVPLAAFAEWGRRRQLRIIAEMVGKCPICAYDLRAHKPGDKCPECGTTVPAKFDSPSSKI